MNRVAHFEIHATDPEKVADFYRKLFGWDIKKWDGPFEYWLVMTGKEYKDGKCVDKVVGIDGGIVKRQGGKPAHGASVSAYVCTIVVDDVDAYLAKAVSLGGTVALPKSTLEGVGDLAYCIDIDGNIFGLHKALTK